MSKVYTKDDVRRRLELGPFKEQRTLAEACYRDKHPGISEEQVRVTCHGTGKTTEMLLDAVANAWNGCPKVLIVGPDTKRSHALVHRARQMAEAAHVEGYFQATTIVPVSEMFWADHAVPALLVDEAWARHFVGCPSCRSGSSTTTAVFGPDSPPPHCPVSRQFYWWFKAFGPGGDGEYHPLLEMVDSTNDSLLSLQEHFERKLLGAYGVPTYALLGGKISEENTKRIDEFFENEAKGRALSATMHATNGTCSRCLNGLKGTQPGTRAFCGFCSRTTDMLPSDSPGAKVAPAATFAPHEMCRTSLPHVRMPLVVKQAYAEAAAASFGCTPEQARAAVARKHLRRAAGPCPLEVGQYLRDEQLWRVERVILGPGTAAHPPVWSAILKRCDRDGHPEMPMRMGSVEYLRSELRLVPAPTPRSTSRPTARASSFPPRVRRDPKCLPKPVEVEVDYDAFDLDVD